MSILIAAAMTAALAGPVEPMPQQRGAPRGSYTQSCSNAYVNRDRLYADCRDRSRQLRSTSIELSRCTNSDISNDNGLLVCGRERGNYENSRPGNPGQGGPGRPGQGGSNHGGPGQGGGRGQITVFSDADYRGRSESFSREIANLQDVRMNDQISSIRAQGRWEVCTDAYFRGSCRIIDGNVRNLVNTGFNDRISSIRPAGRR